MFLLSLSELAKAFELLPEPTHTGDMYKIADFTIGANQLSDPFGAPSHHSYYLEFRTIIDSNGRLKWRLHYAG